MELIVLDIMVTCIWILGVAYSIKRLCGIGLLEDFPGDLKGFRWFLAQTNIFFAIVIGGLISKLLVMPLIQRLFG